MNKKVRTYLLILTAIVFFCLPLASQVAYPAGSSTPSLGTLLQQQNTSENPLLGSRPAPSQPGVISLTLLDAIDRGLKYNLGIILSERGTESATAARLRAMSEMLPHISAHIAESVQQINLAAYGFPVAPGNASVIGPFSVFDTRAGLTENLFDLHYSLQQAGCR